MRRAVGILAMVAVPVFTASLAFAHDTRGHGTMGSGKTAGGFVGQHMMTGTVTDIDKDKGTLAVDADGETLDLHFPKTALQNVNKGDRVTVQLGIKPAAGSATSGMGAGARPGRQGTPTRDDTRSGAPTEAD